MTTLMLLYYVGWDLFATRLALFLPLQTTTGMGSLRTLFKLYLHFSWRPVFVNRETVFVSCKILVFW